MADYIDDLLGDEIDLTIPAFLRRRARPIPGPDKGPMMVETSTPTHSSDEEGWVLKTFRRLQAEKENQ